MQATAKNSGVVAKRSRVQFAAAVFRLVIARCTWRRVMEHFMLSVFPWSTKPLLGALLLFAPAAWAQLPDGPGKEETLKLCTQCHELERSIAPRQDRDGWQATVDKMVRLGAKGTDKDFAVVVEYLATSFPGDQLPKLNVNTAKAIDFESRLSLKRSEA